MVRLAPVCLLIILFCFGLACYWPGLQGGFLFDDYPNLRDLGVYGGIVDWETFKSFVFNGWSGPTGRPIALASFLLDDNTWPSSAPLFKITNLLIHQLCGLLLCWCLLLVLRLYGYTEQKSIWIAVLASMFWMLHPYFVSTTLYVVQRMAQLAAMFSLCGIVVYLKGRLLLETKPRIAYVLMTAGVCLGTLLATFSKENGMLLPMLIVVIEFCCPLAKKPAWQWRAIFLWLPSSVVLVALLRYIDFSANPWPARPFNQEQRLLSELRIVSEYLLHLCIPRIEGRGLFQDGYPISKSFFEPISTFFSFLILLGLATSAFVFRKRWPLFALGLLFFFVAHLTESTVVGLELYFEHRNYLAALFLFLPLAAAITTLADRFSLGTAVVVTSAVIFVLSFMTWQRAKLWSDSEKLELYWAYSTPESARAQNSIARYLSKRGHAAEAERLLEDATKRLSNSALLTMSLLLQKVYSGNADTSSFEKATEDLVHQPFDAQVVAGLRALVEFITEPSGSISDREMTLALLGAMEQRGAYKNFPLFVRLIPYLKAQIYAAQSLPDEALKYYSKAMGFYKDTDAALMMVAEMATRGYFDQALQLLDQAQDLYANQSERTLKKSRGIYDREIALIRSKIVEAKDKTENRPIQKRAH